MLGRIQSWFEYVFYEYMYGEWDSLNKVMWLYVHLTVLIITVFLGVTLAEGDYLLSVLLLPIPLFFLYRRYTYACPS